MTRLPTPLLLACVAALQVTVLCGELVRAAWPRWVGAEVALAVRPVDPRSPFRGDYARLRYDDVSALSWDLFDDDVERVRRGQPLWVVLVERDGRHVPVRVSTTRPSEGTLLRGQPTQARTRGSPVRMDYGLDAFFASPERARELERRMRRGEKATAVVKVLPGGRAGLLDITFPKPG